MAGRYSASFSNQTCVATADTTALTTLKFMALQGGSATQLLKINEVQSGGESGSAAVVSYHFGRDSTVGTATLSLSGAYNALMDANATAPGTVAVPFNTTTGTYPQRSATLGHLVIHDYQAYGGLARWQARQGEELTVYGNTASLGEVSYSGFGNCGTGIVGGHIIYEIA